MILFDLKTLGVIGKVMVGDDPNASFYNRKAKRVFTIDRGSAIDAKTGKAVGTVENLGGRAEHAVSAAGHVFVNMRDL